MGRGSNHHATTGGSRLLYGKSRQGTPQIRLSAQEQTAQALADEIAAYRASGGTVGPSLSGRACEWRTNGQFHRENGPARETDTGDQEWWIDSHRHRIGGPAVITNIGQVWYQMGKQHRKDGPAIERADGSWEWLLNGKRHRIGGPATLTIYGRKEWWRDNQLHNDQGPAITYSDGTEEWYLDGQRYPNEQAWAKALARSS